MAKDDPYIEYAKRGSSEQVSSSFDNWAKIKQWKDPVGGPGAPKDVQPATPVGTGVNKPGDSQA